MVTGALALGACAASTQGNSGEPMDAAGAGASGTGGAKGTGGGSGGVPPSGGSGAGGRTVVLGSGGTGQTGGASGPGGSPTSGSGGAVSSSGSGGVSLGAGGIGGTPSGAGGVSSGAGGAGGGQLGTGGSSAAGNGGASGSAGSTGTCGGGSAKAGDVTVNLSDVHQKISGFGASTAWGSTMSSSDADLLWSTTTGAGLSLHRVRIDYQTGQTSELAIAKMAVAHGVTVWATPWTPPAADKTGNTGANGEVEGTLSNGSALATFLAGFVNYMSGQGVKIYAVSSQNEPDANVTYESCRYTGSTLASFVGTYMGPGLASTGVKIMAPETQNWCDFPSFESALLSNTSAWGYTSIVATHEYGCTPKAYPEIQAAGKEFWETEIYDQGSTTADPGMGSGLRVAKLINDALTIANMNAWHYWWVYSTAADNGALWDKASNKPSKRLWVEGNFARFVRPGFQRVGTTGTISGVLVSAFDNPADGTVVVVAINNNTTATSLPVFVSGATPCAFTPWVTSSTDSLAAKAAAPVTGSRFTFSLGPQSVTTFIGKP